MFERLSNSWQLVKASFAVLRADKELVLFPIVSMIASIIVMITFAVPMFLAGVFDSATSGDDFGIAGIVTGFLFYLVMNFVVFFMNSALVGAAMIRLRGGDPTVRDGFRIASQHAGQILGYAAISATVGIILRALEERFGLLGQIVSFLGGVAWSVATYLVVPILVIEDIGPVDAVKRSASLLKRTWGEQIVGNFSIGLVFALLTIAALFLVGGPLVLLAIMTGSVAVVVLAIAIAVLVVIGIGLVGSALNGIYVAALYQYAVEGETSSFFAPDLVKGAFRQK